MKKLRTIVLIDDDDISNALNQMTLEEMDITDEIVVFLNGEDALKHFQSKAGQNTEDPELIFLDLNMPGMSGEEFMVHFNALPFLNKDRIKIIVFSASLPPLKYEYFKTLGVENFAEKPLTIEKACELIDKMGYLSNC